MKKPVNLKAILIIASSVLLVLAIATAILWPVLWKGADWDSIHPTLVFGSDSDKHNGYADVTLYGAVADDGKDDTKAFIKAAETGAGIYVPLGTFDIKKTVTLRGQNLKGAGMDRSVIRFNGEGTIVEMKGAAIIDDITLSFADKYLTGKEKAGEQVAIKDIGIVNGAMLRSVKTTNVGTGYYSTQRAANNLSFMVESLIVDKFTYKALEMKDSLSTHLRTVNIGEAKGEVDTAVTLGGSFTLDSFVFSGTKCNYLFELLNCESATVNSLVFDGVEAKSGNLFKSVSSVLSMRTVTVKDSKATTLIKLEDTADGGESMGNVISLWSNSGNITVDAENKIKCDNNVSQ